MTYAELQQQVADYMHRTDLGAQIPNFIEYARARINRDLRVREMIKETPVTPISNPFQVPLDFLEMRDLYYEGDSLRIPMTLVGRRQLDLYARGSVTRPLFYSIDGMVIETAPPGTDVDFVQIYYASNPPLVNDADTNLTLEVYPTIWLYASLIEAHSYAQDLTLMEQATSFYTSELSRANQAADMSESGASLQMQGAATWL